MVPVLALLRLPRSEKGEATREARGAQQTRLRDKTKVLHGTNTHVLKRFPKPSPSHPQLEINDQALQINQIDTNDTEVE